MTATTGTDIKEEAIRRYLRHIADDYLYQVARSWPTDQEAAKALREREEFSGSYWHECVSWQATKAGLRFWAPHEPGTRDWDNPDGKVTFLEIARVARRPARQATMFDDPAGRWEAPTNDPNRDRGIA